MTVVPRTAAPEKIPCVAVPVAVMQQMRAAALRAVVAAGNAIAPDVLWLFVFIDANTSWENGVARHGPQPGPALSRLRAAALRQLDGVAMQINAADEKAPKIALADGSLAAPSDAQPKPRAILQGDAVCGEFYPTSGPDRGFCCAPAGHAAGQHRFVALREMMLAIPPAEQPEPLV